MAASLELAVGFFDGVHLGHLRILGTMLERARAVGATPAVLTFREHPLAVLAPAKAPPLLMTCADRLAFLAARTGGRIVALDFDRALAAVPAGDFAESLRVRFPGLDRIFCGANWHFGADGRGNAALLRACGFDIVVVPFAEYRGVKISSTRVRLAVQRGELDAAAAMLGRPFTMCGPVVKGKGLGRSLGFPTANLVPAPGLVLPPFGAYSVRVDGRGYGVANLGLAPTLGDRAWTLPTLEVHFFDDPGDLSGSALAVEFLRFLRPERRFDSLEALRVQLARDLAAARA